MSGHSPVCIKVDVAKANNPPDKITRNPMLNWSCSTSDQRQNYVHQLEDLLSQDHHDTPACLQCEDVLCNHADHLFEIDQVAKSLMSAVTDSGDNWGPGK